MKVFSCLHLGLISMPLVFSDLSQARTRSAENATLMFVECSVNAASLKETAPQLDHWPSLRLRVTNQQLFRRRRHSWRALKLLRTKLSHQKRVAGASSKIMSACVGFFRVNCVWLAVMLNCVPIFSADKDSPQMVIRSSVGAPSMAAYRGGEAYLNDRG